MDYDPAEFTYYKIRFLETDGQWHVLPYLLTLPDAEVSFRSTQWEIVEGSAIVIPPVPVQSARKT
jgi:hypothetical protein